MEATAPRRTSHGHARDRLDDLVVQLAQGLGPQPYTGPRDARAVGCRRPFVGGPQPAESFQQAAKHFAIGQPAWQKAVKKHAGKAALIQRCQIHKRRNVVSHRPEEYRESIDRKMANAYQMASQTEAQRELAKLLPCVQMLPASCCSFPERAKLSAGIGVGSRNRLHRRERWRPALVSRLR